MGKGDAGKGQREEESKTQNMIQDELKGSVFLTESLTQHPGSYQICLDH